MFTNQPDPLGDQIRILSMEFDEAYQRKGGLALTAVIRRVRAVYPDAESLLLVGNNPPYLHSVKCRRMIVDREELLAGGWQDHLSHTYHASFLAFVASGLTEPGGPIQVDRQNSPTYASVDIDAFLRIPLGLWYPRRPGEPQLGPDGHRNAVLAERDPVSACEVGVYIDDRANV